MRGGRIVLKPIDAPAKQSWDSAVEAVQDAIELEKTVNQVLFWQSIEVDMLFHNYYYQLLSPCCFCTLDRVRMVTRTSATSWRPTTWTNR